MATTKVTLTKSIRYQGRSWPLVLTFQNQDIEEGHYDGTVMLPDDYPDSALAQAIREDGEGRLAYINLSFVRSRAKIELEFCRWRPYFLWRNDDEEPSFGFLHGFYVQANKWATLATVEERNSLKGLGKEMLCAAIRVAYEKGEMRGPGRSYILAEADGGRADPAEVAHFKSLGEDAVRLLLWEENPLAASLFLHDYARFGPEQDLAEYLVTTRANARLVKYYEDNLGFTLMQPAVTMASFIGAPLEDLLEKCASQEP